MISEQSLEVWAGAPSETEQTKCDNAVNVIRQALGSSTLLECRTIRVFAQGSYCNRTNVRQDSDVDICALCSDTMFYDIPVGTSAATFGLSPAQYDYPRFKNDISVALNAFFRPGHVIRGNKAFDIKENTYRIAADVVPCFVFKEFTSNGATTEGVAFVSDAGQRIVNWPEQNYTNGVAKNTATRRRFKGIVRIIKRLRYRMNDEKVPAAASIPSFLIESLIYNVPDAVLQADTYTATVRGSLFYIYQGTETLQSCTLWKEVNERKALFESGQAWTCEQVNSFIVAAWSYLGFS